MKARNVIKAAIAITVTVVIVNVVWSSKPTKVWPQVTEVNEQIMLESIRAVENSGWRTGARGEKGPYQIHPNTWDEHCNIPISLAPKSYHDRVALSVLRNMAHILRKRNIEVNPYNLALAWCSGPYYKKPSRHALNYASRLRNYYGSLDETKHSELQQLPQMRHKLAGQSDTRVAAAPVR
jgi:hypothetical protein